ncbi:MAG: class I SAM-dependent methyltransferase [Pyrinomonadaceae bacterium]|nr:class I SAM-dependent methyltransferase [Pyrinomonadaceae bacterium]
MPTIEQNIKLWSGKHEWSDRGDNWSRHWGGVESEWFGAIFPRIHAFLPTGTILEIGSGFGRWTQYLKNHAAHLIIVDLVESCIESCKQRFSSDSHITYHVNDGQSLAMVPDESIDFVFSFDSLVHVEAKVIEAYLGQLANKLKRHGVGFIHHSNIDEYRHLFSLDSKIRGPYKLKKFLRRIGLLEADWWRAHDMSASLFERYCEEVGLQCISQELVNWQGKRLIDAFSLFTRKESMCARPNRIFRNYDFMEEAKYISYLSPMYVDLLPKTEPSIPSQHEAPTRQDK